MTSKIPSNTIVNPVNEGGAQDVSPDKGTHNNRSVKKVAPEQQSKLDRTPATDQPVVLSERTGFAVGSQLEILKGLIAREQWEGAKSALSHCAPDLDSMRKVLDEFPVAMRSKEWLGIVSEHFSQCFAQEKGAVLTLPASQREQEMNPFTRYETLSKLLEKPRQDTDSAIRAVALGSVDDFFSSHELFDAHQEGDQQGRISKQRLIEQSAKALNDTLISYQKQLDDACQASMEGG